MAVLDQAGIAHCGVDRAAEHKPAILRVGGLRVAFLAYTSICWPFGQQATDTTAGVATVRASTSYLPDYRVVEVPGRAPRVLTTPLPEELAGMEDDIRRTGAQADAVVVSMHWGIAGEKIADYQSAIAYAAIDAGADIVVGHGPHTLQAVETYRGRPVLYSLGNLVFDWPVMHHRHREGLLARITLDHDTTSSTGGAGTVTGVELLPVRRDDDNQARLLTGPDADHVLQHVVRLGVPLSGRDEA